MKRWNLWSYAQKGSSYGANVVKRLSVGELKANFSAVLHDVEQGESVTVEYGRRHTPVAVIEFS